MAYAMEMEDLCQMMSQDTSSNFVSQKSFASDDDNKEVCALCDDGGKLLSCEGGCLRAFHPTKKAGKAALCSSLGFTKEKVKAMKKRRFKCKNCKYKQHQCFACGKLGSTNVEVFKCANSICEHFYHLKCVFGLLKPGSNIDAPYFKKIDTGNVFICPVHKCSVCNEEEDQTKRNLQFAICRRCPKVYHRKCLPRGILFEEAEAHGLMQRAWEDLLPNKRILTYCLSHEIDEHLRTASRNHIIFPKNPKKRKVEALSADVQFARRKKRSRLVKKQKNKTEKHYHSGISNGQEWSSGKAAVLEENVEDVISETEESSMEEGWSDQNRESRQRQSNILHEKTQSQYQVQKLPPKKRMGSSLEDRDNGTTDASLEVSEENDSNFEDKRKSTKTIGISNTSEAPETTNQTVDCALSSSHYTRNSVVDFAHPMNSFTSGFFKSCSGATGGWIDD